MENKNGVPRISWKEIEVEELIGSGTFGKVYKGKWNGNTVAIKQLFLKKLSNDLKKAFEEECSQLYSCRYPQITQLVGACIEEGHYAMVLEFLSKGSLYDVLHDSSDPLPWNPLRWKIAIEIARGMEYLHDTLKIVHGDLKSINILMDKDYSPKITDFGLSTIKLESSTTNYKGKGTVRWMAPELFVIRKARPTFASDVYSYGMILWELTSRKIPFAEALNEIVAAGWIAGGQTEVIDKCWHFDPSLKAKLNSKGSSYVLIDATPKDKGKVVKWYSHHPVPNMDIKSVKTIFNPILNRQFELRLRLLEERHSNDAFQAKWIHENNSAWRAKVMHMLNTMSAPYKDTVVPHVQLLPLWHGTKESALEGIFKAGFASLATTDSGFFGKGIYGSHEAEYAYQVYSKGALLLYWVAFYSAYPVIHGDTSKLAEKGHYQNYDAHFVPVIPSSGQFSCTDSAYYPCKPNQQHQYTELVVFDSAQCLPQYLIELQPSLPVAPNSNISDLTKQLNDNSITTTTQSAAQLYTFGTKCEQGNWQQAAKYYQLAAAQGHAGAQCNLGYCYATGNGVAKDAQQAVKYYQLAADQGQAAAQYNLGLCYEFGTGVAKDEQQAVKYYKMAAAQGHAGAQCNLGVCYAHGTGVSKDAQQAVKYYQLAAAQGQAAAQYNLGLCYDNGRGVSKDAQQAVKYYQLAAAQGHAEAQFNLGLCYEYGTGVSKDVQQAVKYYQLAAAQGDADAQFKMGHCHLYGTGVTKDAQQAFKYYQLAADQGHEEAIQEMFNVQTCKKSSFFSEP